MSRVPPETTIQLTWAEAAVELRLAAEFEQLQWVNLLMQPLHPNLNDLRLVSLDGLERRKVAITMAAKLLKSFADLADAESVARMLDDRRAG